MPHHIVQNLIQPILIANAFLLTNINKNKFIFFLDLLRFKNEWMRLVSFGRLEILRFDIYIN